MSDSIMVDCVYTISIIQISLIHSHAQKLGISQFHCVTVTVTVSHHYQPLSLSD